MDLDALRRDLLALELALANRDSGAIPDGLGALIADDCVEFGASGRTWSAHELRTLVTTPPPAGRPPLEIEAFDVDVLAPDVVLTTYRLLPPAASSRSSIWVRRDGRWLLRFHQGTPDGRRR
jgi:hypothetical protein